MHSSAELRLSVTQRYCVKTAKHIAEILLAPGNPSVLSVYFLKTERRCEIPTGSPLTSAINIGGV